MSVRVTETTNPPGAWLYDENRSRIFGPMFQSVQEAESFLSFLSNVDASLLDWGAPHENGDRLLELWESCGKVPQRPPPVFDTDWISRGGREWSFICEMGDVPCFPLFVGVGGCHEICKILEERGVITEDMNPDPERSCLYVNFRTKKIALKFLDNLNSFLKKNWHLAYPEKQP